MKFKRKKNLCPTSYIVLSWYNKQREGCSLNTSAIVVCKIAIKIPNTFFWVYPTCARDIRNYSFVSNGMSRDSTDPSRGGSVCGVFHPVGPGVAAGSAWYLLWSLSHNQWRTTPNLCVSVTLQIKSLYWKLFPFFGYCMILVRVARHNFIL